MRGCLECVDGSMCCVFGREWCMSGGLAVCTVYHNDLIENEFLI